MPPSPSTVAGSSSASQSTPRPVRPLCRYISLPGGCHAGAACKFRHSEEATQTPHQEAQTCRFFAAGFCKRGASCWYKHVGESPMATAGTSAGASQEAGPSAPPTIPAVGQSGNQSDDEDYTCMICYEKPLQYALLAGCSHVFCLACMRGWRDSKDKEVSMLESGVIKACPVCRIPSRFVTPSSQFYPEGHTKKAEMITAYKSSMARVPCRYFSRSLTMGAGRPFCPYGHDCFYEHKLANGDAFFFQHGAEHYMTIHRERIARRRREDVAQQMDIMADMLFTHGFGGAADVRRQMRTDGFWNELFTGIVANGPVSDGPARPQREVDSIRALLNSVARHMGRPQHEGDDDDDDDLPPLMPVLPAAVMINNNGAARRQAAPQQARTPPYFGPRPPSPHPAAARDGAAPPEDGDGEENGDMPDLLSMSDSSESEYEEEHSASSEDEENASGDDAAARLEETRAARARFFGGFPLNDRVPPPRQNSRTAQRAEHTTSDDMPPLTDLSSEEDADEEDEDGDSDVDDDEEPGVRGRSASPARQARALPTLRSSSVTGNQTAPRSRQTGNAEVRRSSTPGPPPSRRSPATASSSGASFTIDIGPLARRLSTGSSSGRSSTAQTSNGVALADASPTAEQEQALGALPSTSRASRFLSGLFRRDASDRRSAA